MKNATIDRIHALIKRQDAIGERLIALEEKMGHLDLARGADQGRDGHKAALFHHIDCVQHPQATDQVQVEDLTSRQVPEDPQGTIQRLSKELDGKKITNYAFVRAPPQYYDEELEFRRQVLKADSVHQLCKSIVMENTKVEAGTEYVKYWLVITQYSARLDNNKLKAFIHSHHQGRLAKTRINMRLVAEDVSHEMTGFGKNAVSPVGLTSDIPMILSKDIVLLKPNIFWVGGGEVDLKLGMAVKEFVDAYKPYVVDITDRSDC